MFKNAFAFLQKIGKALMLPVAVLPVAGLLLGIGAANFEWMPALLSGLMKNSGDVIFGNLPLIFAIGVAVGFTENDGVSAIAATIGYMVMLATMGVMAGVWKVEPVMIMGIKSMQTGVFGGILAGGLAAGMFNRFYRISLPPYLGFFAGKRFVPIITAIAANRPGRGALRHLDACITRLRVVVKDAGSVDQAKLKAMGAAGVMVVGNSIQAIFGTPSENMKTDMEKYLKTAGSGADGGEVPTSTLDVDNIADHSSETAPIEPQLRKAAEQMLLALGGPGNLRKIEAVACTRLRVEMADTGKFDAEGAQMAGVAAVMQVAPEVFHLIVGEKAGQFAQAMRKS